MRRAPPYRHPGGHRQAVEFPGVAGASGALRSSASVLYAAGQLLAGEDVAAGTEVSIRAG